MALAPVKLCSSGHSGFPALIGTTGCFLGGHEQRPSPKAEILKCSVLLINCKISQQCSQTHPGYRSYIMEEIVQKMACWGGSDAGQSRRK